MAATDVLDLVAGVNLGNEFDQGNIEADKVHIKVEGTRLLRAADGTLTTALSALDWNNTTKVLTFTNEDGNDTVVDLASFATDIFVNGGSFDAASGVLTLTDADGGTPDVTIDLSALLGVSTNAGQILANGTDGKPLLTSAALATELAANQLDVVNFIDIFGNPITGEAAGLQ